MAYTTLISAAEVAEHLADLAWVVVDCRFALADTERGRRDYLAVWIGVLLAAIPVWLWWPVGSHGLSGVVYGLLGYLLVIGWLEKRPLSIVLSLIALVGYGGVLPSLIPLFSPAGVRVGPGR